MKLCDTSPKSDLDWDNTLDPDGIYSLDFGWTCFDPQNIANFNRDYLAVEEFAKTFPDAKRVVMAHLDGDFLSLIQINEKLEKERGNVPLEVYCAQLFSDYLHRLASALPTEAIPVVNICPKKELDPALMILMFSRRRFEHFDLQFEENSLPVQGDKDIVISLPQDEFFDLIFYNQLLKQYDNVKWIPEEFLNEHWDEVSEIIYDPQTIGELGKRMLLGFEAAGGEIKKAR